MDCRFEVVNGKTIKVFERKGRWYKRVIVEVEISQYKHALSKAGIFGKNFTDLTNELIMGFNNSMGFGKHDELVKDAGSLFDNRISSHILTAAHRTIEEIAQCRVDVSTN